MEKNLTLSVHQLVDFLLRTGDIDNRIYNSATMQEGTLIHAMYQARQGDNYISEYKLVETCYHDTPDQDGRGQRAGAGAYGDDKE